MELSVAGFSVHGLFARGEIDIFGYLEACRYRFGLQTADIWNGLLPTIEPEFLTKVRNGLEERELTLVNYHVDGVHLWENDREARQRNYQKALLHLRAAATLGAKTVRFDTGGTVVPMTPEQLDLVSSRYREYCAFGHDHGFFVGPETHWGFSLLADNMEAIAKTVDHPAYGILLHIGHWEGGDPDAGGDPDDGDRRLAPYTVHTHVDATITRTTLAEKMDLLLSAGYAGCWGVEHHSAENEYAEIGYQLGAVRRALARRLRERQKAENEAQAVGQSLADNPLLTAEQERRANTHPA